MSLRLLRAFLMCAVLVLALVGTARAASTTSNFGGWLDFNTPDYGANVLINEPCCNQFYDPNELVAVRVMTQSSQSVPGLIQVGLYKSQNGMPDGECPMESAWTSYQERILANSGTAHCRSDNYQPGSSGACYSGVTSNNDGTWIWNSSCGSQGFGDTTGPLGFNQGTSYASDEINHEGSSVPNCSDLNSNYGGGSPNDFLHYFLKPQGAGSVYATVSNSLKQSKVTPSISTGYTENDPGGTSHGFNIIHAGDKCTS